MARLIDGDKVLERIERITQCWRQQGNDYEANLISASVKSILSSEPAIPQDTRWISVKDRLPDTETDVWLQCMTCTGYKYQCQGFYVPDGIYREDSAYWWDYECCDQYDEERDDYMVNPGWYERIYNWDDYGAVWIADTVTHWMPLPSPPKTGGTHE